jgi:hypothetical protein
MKIFVFCIALWASLYSAELKPPRNIKMVYNEKSLELFWDSVPGASGYNIYSSPVADANRKKRRRVNLKLITSGPHFVYIWNFEKGKRVRKIKGYEHHLCVTAVCSTGGKEVESAFSREVDNCYFEGYRNVDSMEKIQGILRKKQRTPFLPVEKHVIPKKDFIQFMLGPGSSCWDREKNCTGLSNSI